ncbi:MAG: hypothetical protein P8176_07370 [Gammaproteobacteria bacterium]
MSKNKKEIVSLDQIDAVCDELLKAFELADRSGEGELDRDGFQRFLAVLSGENVRIVDFQRSTEMGNTGTGGAASTSRFAWGHEGSRQVSGVFERKNPFDDLNDAGCALLSQKKRELLACTFEEIDDDCQGVISGDQVLDAVGLAVALDFIIANTGRKSLTLTDLWPRAEAPEVQGECVETHHDLVCDFENERKTFNEKIFRVLSSFVGWRECGHGQ